MKRKVNMEKPRLTGITERALTKTVKFYLLSTYIFGHLPPRSKVKNQTF